MRLGAPLPRIRREPDAEPAAAQTDPPSAEVEAYFAFFGAAVARFCFWAPWYMSYSRGTG